MAADSMFVFDANPHAPSIINSEEEALVRTLFANFDTAWNHPALQTRLIRAWHQPRRQSILNGMTLFGAIWSASKLPNFRSYKVVWDAMRVHLENDGVLAALVSKFNAYVARIGRKTTDSRLVQLQTHLEAPQAPGSFTSIPREDAGHHQTKRRKSLGEIFHKSDKLSPTYSLQEPTPPAHRNREEVYYSQSPSSHLSTCSIYSENYANEARTCNEGSSYPQDSEFHHHPFLYSGSSGSGVRTQTDIYHESFPGGSKPGPFVPVFPDTTSYLGLTYGMGHGKEQLSEPDATETRQTPANIGIASNPSNLAFHDYFRFPELNSYVDRRQAHQSNTMHLPCSTASYNLPFSRSQDACWGGCVERGSECDRYNGLQNGRNTRECKRI
ncbi:hypothetical protein GGU10DRAFT_333527 [Lentinula aff. detonsa]|uniref:Uncharacterized protein n=1 Tax=Lentinula aff. detonsa TaxID=2804958 RepID=A0AA38NLU1_9AGAR|nr:hypothetical protein GGU10DRAFT_333527 [Lentinula aff. detonsa]